MIEEAVGRVPPNARIKFSIKDLSKEGSLSDEAFDTIVDSFTFQSIYNR